MREKYLKWKEEEERIMKKDLEMSSAQSFKDSELYEIKEAR